MTASSAQAAAPQAAVVFMQGLVLNANAQDSSAPPPSPPPAPEVKQKLIKAGELSRRTGLTRQALHQYVLMGLIEPVTITKGGQRLFSEEIENHVKLIRNLRSQGYTLKDVKDIFKQPKS
jgi:hypothetical protein